MSVCFSGSCLISSLLTATAAGVIWMQRLGDFQQSLRGTVRHCHRCVRRIHTAMRLCWMCAHTNTTVHSVLHKNTLPLFSVGPAGIQRIKLLIWVCTTVCARHLQTPAQMPAHLPTGSTSTFFKGYFQHKHKHKDKVRTRTTENQ